MPTKEVLDGLVDFFGAILRHCKPKGIVKHDTLTNGGSQQLTLINEPNVYRLIIKSSLP